MISIFSIHAVVLKIFNVVIYGIKHVNRTQTRVVYASILAFHPPIYICIY